MGGIAWGEMVSGINKELSLEILSWKKFKNVVARVKGEDACGSEDEALERQRSEFREDHSLRGLEADFNMGSLK